MKEFILKKSPVIFDGENHEYWLGDRQLFGVTSTLMRRAFPGKYSSIPKETLERAARKGSEVHDAIEYHDHFGGCEDNPRIASYVRLKKEYGLRTIANEYLVSDEERYASKIDIVMANEADELCIVDTKTTYDLDKPAVALQTSIYKWLFEKQNHGLEVKHIYALWLPNKDETIGELHELSFVDEEYLSSLVDADKAGCDLAFEKVPEEWEELEAEYRKWSRNKEEAEEMIFVIKGRMMQLMRERNVSSIRTDSFTFSYIPPSVTRRFDSALFKKENKDLYSKYMVESRGAEQIRISARKPSGAESSNNLN